MSTDTGTEISTETGTDAVTDTGTDTGTDSGTSTETGTPTRGNTTPAPTDRQALLLARRAGATPAYLYDRGELRAAVARVRAASIEGAGLYYSLKANPHPGVVNALAPLVDGFDVCSRAEMETALDSGTPPGRVLFTGPAKSGGEAAAALAAEVAVTVESPRQAALLAATARELGIGGRAVIRLNTPYPARVPGGEPSPNQFGVDADDEARVVETLRAGGLSVSGLQLFWGSQYADPAVVHAARVAMTARALACVDRFALEVDFVSVGGGIAMPWCDADPDVDWAAMATPLSALPDGAAGLPLVCEYGRSLVGPAGSLLTTVLDTKTVGGLRHVLVDAGMNHVMIASRLVAGNGRGEVRVRAVGAPPDAPTGPVRVTGPLCSQLDVLADGVLLPEVEPGDLLLFAGVGAYGPTFSPGGFLSRDPAREVVHGDV
ncbi:alanine racemase [Streptomyces sp. NPDC047737]|uniref:alanine racemase n=1 Tax=Streptomyces sp. NPDC047737 TaxID=3155740 RepID=UPI0033C61DEC